MLRPERHHIPHRTPSADFPRIARPGNLSPYSAPSSFRASTNWS